MQAVQQIPIIIRWPDDSQMALHFVSVFYYLLNRPPISQTGEWGRAPSKRISEVGSLVKHKNWLRYVPNPSHNLFTGGRRG